MYTDREMEREMGSLLRAGVILACAIMLAGGILLLWVCWKIWRELRSSSIAEQDTLDNWDISRDGTIAGRARRALLLQK